MIFDKAEPNPLASTAMKGAAVAKEEGCDVIVGLGGGSIMDCSKAVAFAACNEGNIFDYIYGIKRRESPSADSCSDDMRNRKRRKLLCGSDRG